MSKTFLLILLIVSFRTVSGQKIQTKIDSLETNDAVVSLLFSLDKKYRGFDLRHPYGKEGYFRKIADSLGIIKSFYKSDFDNNGYTDLLVIGEFWGINIVIVMNYGYDTFKLSRFSRGTAQGCTWPKIINDTIIRDYHRNWQTNDTTSILRSSDLIFKYGGFIEYNALPKNYMIEKIEYQTRSHRTNPQFLISIDNNRKATFKAEAYNQNKINEKEIKGKFETLLNKVEFSKIVSLLDYIDFPSLKDSNTVPWPDDHSCTLTITYNNGQVKKIEDFGLSGTHGLFRLYQILFDLRYNQKWK